MPKTFICPSCNVSHIPFHQDMLWISDPFTLRCFHSFNQMLFYYYFAFLPCHCLLDTLHVVRNHVNKWLRLSRPGKHTKNLAVQIYCPGHYSRMQGKYDLAPQIHCLGFHLGKLENFKQDIFGVVCRRTRYMCVSGGGGKQGHTIHFYTIIPSNTLHYPFHAVVASGTTMFLQC